MVFFFMRRYKASFKVSVIFAEKLCALCVKFEIYSSLFMNNLLAANIKIRKFIAAKIGGEGGE